MMPIVTPLRARWEGVIPILPGELLAPGVTTVVQEPTPLVSTAMASLGAAQL